MVVGASGLSAGVALPAARPAEPCTSMLPLLVLGSACCACSAACCGRLAPQAWQQECVSAVMLCWARGCERACHSSAALRCVA